MTFSKPRYLLTVRYARRLRLLEKSLSAGIRMLLLDINMKHSRTIAHFNPLTTGIYTAIRASEREKAHRKVDSFALRSLRDGTCNSNHVVSLFIVVRKKRGRESERTVLTMMMMIEKSTRSSEESEERIEINSAAHEYVLRNTSVRSI